MYNYCVFQNIITYYENGDNVHRKNIRMEAKKQLKYKHPHWNKLKRKKKEKEEIV